MGEPTGLALWAEERWQAEALRWVDDRLAAAGLSRTGKPTQPHARTWATVLTPLAVDDKPEN